MPILERMAVAAATAAALLLLFAWPWRAPRPALVRVGSVLGVAIGFFVGCWLLDARPQWPPKQDQDRLLFVLLPTLVGVELTAALPGWLSWLVWPLRLVVVAGAARVLLHDSVYLGEWTPAQTAANLGGWACALAVVWTLLALLAKRTSSRSVPLAVALACVGAGVTIMLSAYATGGPMGFALGAALAGSMAASVILSGPPDVCGVLGPGVVGFFALLVSGKFFGELTLANAALLFFAPLLCWLPEFPPRLRSLCGVALVAVPVAVAALLAKQEFDVASTRTSSGSEQPASKASPYSSEDYRDYEKGK